MITKMNYLLLSTVMLAAIDSTFGKCCPCEKKGDEHDGEEINTLTNNAYQDGGQTINDNNLEGLITNEKLKNENNYMIKNDDEIIYTKNSDNEILSNISNKNFKNEYGETNNMSILDDSNVLNPNPVIVQNATEDNTKVLMEDTTRADNLENDNLKNNIKSKPKCDEDKARLLWTMGFLNSGCSKSMKCKDEQNVNLKLVTVNSNNQSKEDNIDIPLCQKHNRCNIRQCKKPPMYLLQCGHIFCQSHFNSNVRATLCEKCKITLCGAMWAEYDHQICAVTDNPHYHCYKKTTGVIHKVYGKDSTWYCEKHEKLMTQNFLKGKGRVGRCKK